MHTRTPPPLLASALALLFVLSLILTLLGIGSRGSGTPLAHGLAGAAAIFFTLFMVSERHNPNPLLPRPLRNSYAVQISLWTSLFSAAVIAPVFILQITLMAHVDGFSILSIIATGAALLLLMFIGKNLSKKLTRHVTADKSLLSGFAMMAAAQGSRAVLPEISAFWLAILLSGLGAGMVYHARNAGLQKITASTAVRLNKMAACTGGAVTLALLVMLLAVYPGHEGFEHGFAWLTVFALAGMVAALMVEE